MFRGDDRREAAIQEARDEWADLGLLMVSTVAALTELGVDVYSLEREFEQENCSGWE